MAHPDRYTTSDPEQDGPIEHPLLATAKTFSNHFYERYMRGTLSQEELVKKFFLMSCELTQEAQKEQLVGRPARISSNELHYPIIEKPRGGEELRFRWAVLEPSERDLAFGTMPSQEKRFSGIRHKTASTGLPYFTLQFGPPPTPHQELGDFSPHTWCPLEGASLEFLDDSQEQQVERLLGIIERQQPQGRVDQAIQRLDQSLRDSLVGKHALQSSFLSSISEPIMSMLTDPEFRDNDMLNTAVLDLATERLALPRHLTIRADYHWRDTFRHPMRSRAMFDFVEDPTEFNDIEPVLVFHARHGLAQVCFAAIHQGRSVRIPFDAVEYVIIKNPTM